MNSPHNPPLTLSDFDYELPPERIAQAPAPRRDGSRLLVLPRRGPVPRELRHLPFRELPDLLQPGDLLVMNDTRVRRARLRARRPGGGAVELLLVERLEPEGARWLTLARPAARLRPGMVLTLEGADIELVAIERARDGAGQPAPEWVVEFRSRGADVEALIEELGELPLPPYVRRPPGPSAELDLERYQTVVARRPGAVAAPTAGLHFTPELLAEIEGRGVALSTITLHVGPGTFRPVGEDDLRRHRMHAERYEISAAAAEAVAAARARGGRIVAVGTTVVRTLESAAGADGLPRAGTGRTDLFLRPGDRLRVIDALVTNFHLPKSTLLMLVAAFAGREATLDAYARAVEHGYRFFSYGDAMFIA